MNISSDINKEPLYADLMSKIENAQEVVEKVIYRSGCSLQVRCV